MTTTETQRKDRQVTEFGENLSEEVLGQHDETPERGRPGTNPPADPQPGLHPGAGEPAEPGDGEPSEAGDGEPAEAGDGSGPPAQGFGQPDSQ